MGCQLHSATQKLALITIKRNGLSIAFGNPKKQWAIRPPPFKRASSNLDLSMVFLRQRKEFLAYECVALMQLRISVQFLVSDRLNSLIEDRCLLLRYPTHIFFLLSLILRERRHHELSIVLTAKFFCSYWWTLIVWSGTASHFLSNKRWRHLSTSRIWDRPWSKKRTGTTSFRPPLWRAYMT